jgi:hypothetical protein
MVNVHVFVENDPQLLEDNINEWLDEHPNINIKAVTQSGERMVNYTILYEE